MLLRPFEHQRQRSVCSLFSLRVTEYIVSGLRSNNHIGRNALFRAPGIEKHADHAQGVGEPFLHWSRSANLLRQGAYLQVGLLHPGIDLVWLALSELHVRTIHGVEALIVVQFGFELPNSGLEEEGFVKDVVFPSARRRSR